MGIYAEKYYVEGRRRVYILLYLRGFGGGTRERSTLAEERVLLCGVARRWLTDWMVVAVAVVVVVTVAQRALCPEGMFIRVFRKRKKTLIFRTYTPKPTLITTINTKFTPTIYTYRYGPIPFCNRRDEYIYIYIGLYSSFRRCFFCCRRVRRTFFVGKCVNTRAGDSADFARAVRTTINYVKSVDGAPTFRIRLRPSYA